MASRAEHASNGEKVAPAVITVEQAERGEVVVQGKRGTGLSAFGPRKRLSMEPDSTQSGGRHGATSSTRPIFPKKTPSLNTQTPQMLSSTKMSLKSQREKLCLAVAGGDTEALRFMLDKLNNDDMLVSAGFTTQDASGNGLLQIASLYGHSNVLEMLLEYGININGVDRNHGTALQAAIYMGRKEIYRRLLGPKRSGGHSTSYHAQLLVPPDQRYEGKFATQEKLDYNTKDKIDVNTKGGYYGCALQVAAYRANSDLVVELVRNHQAKINLSGGKYGYPLQAAVRTGRRAVVEPILSRCDADGVNNRGGKYGTALQAVARGRYRTRMTLLEISRGQVLKQPAMSSPGNPINRADSDASEDEYVEVAAMLFAQNAQLDGGTGRLGNPINAAACSGSVPMLRLMLENFDKRSPNWVENKSDVLTQSLLTAITQSPENQKLLAKLLVENDARIQYKTSAILPNLPLEAAATKNLLEVVDFLLNTRDTAGGIADTLAESGIHGTALRAAIAGSKPDHEEVAACFINRIAEQWGLKELSPTERSTGRSRSLAEIGDEASRIQPIKRKTGDNELDWTEWDSEYGNLLQLATFAGLKKTVSLLLKYGADPNVRDTSQRTALHIAAWSGFPQIVRLLLNKNLPKRADVSLKDEWGATPLDQAEESLDRNGHPGATERDLQEIIQILRREMGSISIEQPGMEFRGPKKKTADMSSTQDSLQGAKPVFSMPSWIPGVGFRATIVDVWESDDQEYLLLKKPRIEEILYHKAVLDSIMASTSKPAKGKDKLRWIHIPANNMTWAEMLIASLCKERKLPPYKSLWGTDPFYTSSDLSPHARFIAPQCGTLIPEDPFLPGGPKRPIPLFMAMPYIHWEAHRARKNVSGMIARVKSEALKSIPTENTKPLWLSERADENAQVHASAAAAIEEPPRMVIETTELEQVILDTPEAEEDYFELLRRYLYKRRPVHLRRTLDQYYYSHLADTNDRDLDQVVMRQFNEDKKNLKLGADPKFEKLLRTKEELEEDDKKPNLVTTAFDEAEAEDPNDSTSKPTTIWQRMVKKLGARGQKEESRDVERKLRQVDHVIYYDDNSPVLMIDQLWLWIVDERTIVTSFPHRQYDRNSEDLDATDKTDILKTIVSYLHNARRLEINNSHALAELIISQCVGILHKADMIPDLDFLKKYSVQSNKWADQVMKMLSNFVKDFEEFMIWIKEQPAESEESIRWFESIFSVTDQTQLLRNIQDIKDELGMLKGVFEDQIQVLTAASGHLEQADCVYGCHVGVLPAQKRNGCPHSRKTFVDQSLKHLKHVERMQVQANQAYDTLKDLLNLKQQQAYVLESRVSRNQAIASGEQSKTIMVFTIVTIIFLPLTFVTTVFTLPIAEFQRIVKPDGAEFPPTPFLSKSYVLKYIVAITFAVAVPLILAAFEIQSVHNGWKKLQLKMAETKRQKKLKEMKAEENGMPDFLNPKLVND